MKHTTLRPKPAAEFSTALTHLLSLPPTTSAPQPKNAPPSAHSQRLERRAKSLIRQTKAEHFDRGHVRDVIAGWAARPALPFSQWESASARRFAKARAGLTAGEEDLVDETGAEREKRLRKLAQRGVVRLFNAIGAAQGAPVRAEEESRKRLRGEEVGSEAGEQRALGPGESIGPGGRITRRPNVLGGRGKGEARKSRLWTWSSPLNREAGEPRWVPLTRPCYLIPCSHQPVQGLFPGPHPRRYDLGAGGQDALGAHFVCVSVVGLGRPARVPLQPRSFFVHHGRIRETGMGSD